MEEKILAVDFDGTLCENEYPLIGKPKLDIIESVKNMKKQGWLITLWTCRKDIALDKAIEWCKQYDLTFDYVNENSRNKIEKYGGDTRKIIADAYLDDKNIQFVDDHTLRF